MHFITRWTLVSLVAVSLAGTSCTSIIDAVRPDKRNLSGELGDAACTPEQLSAPNGTQRFVVEWNDGDRASLEDEMRDGVALVKFSCDGIQLLRSCAVPGTYGYRASNSKKARVLQFEDALSASANFSSSLLGSGLGGDIDQGRSLDLAYVMVGSETTPVKDVTYDQLDRAACKEATHFVYQTQVGAFALKASEQGEVVSASSILGLGGTDSETSSSRQSRVADGDAAACAGSTPDDIGPPQDCGAKMRVTILPLIEGKIDAYSPEAAELAATTPPTCPAGTVYDRGYCVLPTQIQPNLCEHGDVDGCIDACQKQNLESCNRMARAFAKSIPDGLDYFAHYDASVDKYGEEAVARYRTIKYTTLPLLEQACEERDMADACWMAGIIYTLSDREILAQDDSPDAVVDYGKRTFHLMSSACKFGNVASCQALHQQTHSLMRTMESRLPLEDEISDDSERVFLPDLVAGAEKALEESCYAGTLPVCLSLAEAALEGHKSIVDIEKASLALEKACLGGIGEACFWGALAFGSKDASTCEFLLKTTTTPNKVSPNDDPNREDYEYLYHPRDPQQFNEDYQSTCEFIATEDFQKKLAPYAPERAKVLARQACHISGGYLTENACEMSGLLSP